MFLMFGHVNLLIHLPTDSPDTHACLILFPKLLQILYLPETDTFMVILLDDTIVLHGNK